MVYIINHKSPDLDSTIAAIIYAQFKNQLENTDKYKAVTTGLLNKETKYILDKFNIDEPEILNNLAEKDVILVDHNEFSQAQDGIEEAKILEVLDHHKVNFTYNEPIEFCIKPLGASCSIVADKYLNSNYELDKDTASVLLAGILVDTVITKSPTCTKTDKDIIEKLAQIGCIESWEEYGMEIFKVRSSITSFSNKQIIKNDFKDFNFKEGVFGIGQVETVDLNDYKSREDEILNELNKMRKENNYHTIILFITDIIKEGSKFIITSSNLEKVEQALNKKLENNQVYIDGIMSRKKQVIPMISKVFDK